ncbi:hypothetical protein HID58_032174 [Brassica napus]|uniref:Uncharacterized protein n=1 Tax=Brassica napus TaxID=3708 RepID=A0ABQ8BVR7_BRANA|nr:hypothetical protein HID58_032174 [Brassica napus]
MLTALGEGIAPRRDRRRLSQLYDRRPLFLGDGGSVSTVIAGSCFRKAIIKASYFFRLLISHLKRLGMSVVVWSMVDGSDESTLIVFGECLARSSWDSDESAME